MEGGENYKPSRFCAEVNAPRGGWKLAVLRLQHGATLQTDVGATVDLHCKTICFNHLFGDMHIFSIVLSKKEHKKKNQKFFRAGQSSPKEPLLLKCHFNVCKVPMCKMA
jgi:hypothetical protein